VNPSVSGLTEEELESKAEAMMGPLLQQLAELRESEREDEAWAAAKAVILKLSKEILLVKQQALLQRLARTSEKLDPRQLDLLATQLAALEAEEGEELQDRDDDLVDEEVEELIEGAKPPTSGRPVRRQLPEHLPRQLHELDVDDDERTCPCCGAERAVIGREVREVLDIEPIRLKVQRYERLKRACPTCKDSGVVVAAPTDEQLERVMASPRLLAHAASCKYDAHVPLHRLQRLYGHMGLRIASSTLGGWIARTAEELEPLHRALWDELRSQPVVGTDASGLRVLDRDAPDNITLGTMWCYVGYPDAGARLCAYRYSPTGSGADGPWTHLAGQTGLVQADAANVFDRLFNGKAADATEVGCWAHARRKLHGLVDTDSRVAKPLQRIARVYRADKAASVQNMTADERLALRRRVSAQHVQWLHRWLTRTSGREPPASALGKACAYWLNHWAALTRFLDDGRLELDNTEVERQIRALGVGRKNYLFAGSHVGAGRAAVIYSLMRSCDLAGVDPTDWLEGVLVRLAGGWPQSRIGELLPHRWDGEAQQAR